MKIVLMLLLIAAGYAAFEYMRIRPLYHASINLIDSAQGYERPKGNAAMLVLGDSTAVGVGAAHPEDTVAGRIARLKPEFSVENHAVSGARISDLPSQLAEVEREHYSLALVQIGANDIIRFRTAADAAAELQKHLAVLKGRADTLVFLTAGNVGGTVFFPSILRPFYHRRTLQYHAAFEKLAKDLEVSYVNLYAPPDEDPFLKDTARFFSADGLHPSSEGYRLWFEKVERYL